MCPRGRKAESPKRAQNIPFKLLFKAICHLCHLLIPSGNVHKKNKSDSTCDANIGNMAHVCAVTGSAFFLVDIPESVQVNSPPQVNPRSTPDLKQVNMWNSHWPP